VIGRTDAHAGIFTFAEIRDVLAFQYHIPVHEKERAGYQLPDGSHGIRSAMLVALRCVRHVNPEPGPVPEMVSDLPLSIPYNKDEILYSGIPGGKDQMFHHGAVCQGEHHFWTFRRKGAHPRTLPGGENDTFHIYSSSCNI
jgi:hypothetical protein